MNHLRLIRGIALVLAGPQGCGKTTLALRLARGGSSFRQAALEELEAPYGLAQALECKPETLIVDGLPKRERTVELVHQMLANEHTVAERKNAWPLTVPSPKLIFCTTHMAAARHLRGSRRFHVVILPASGTQH